MRRFLALAALLATTWPHVAVMECAAMEPTVPVPHASSVVAEHAHAGPDCPALMACSSLMVEGAQAETGAEPSTPSHEIGVAPSVTPTGTVLTADPPPPRRPA